jgi:hypothetical protein
MRSTVGKRRNKWLLVLPLSAKTQMHEAKEVSKYLNKHSQFF